MMTMLLDFLERLKGGIQEIGEFLGMSLWPQRLWSQKTLEEQKLVRQLYAKDPNLTYLDKLKQKTGIDISANYNFPERQSAKQYELSLSFIPNMTEIGVLMTVDGGLPLFAGKKYYANIESRRPEFLSQLHAELAKLTELNPELAGLEFDRNDLNESLTVLVGIAENIKVEDINWFITHGMMYGKVDIEPYNALKKRLVDEAGLDSYLCLAPETLLDVYRQALEQGKITNHQTVEACRSFCREFNLELPVSREFTELSEKTGEGKFARSQGSAVEHLAMRQNGTLPDPLGVTPNQT